MKLCIQNLGIKSATDMVSIAWEVDGSSGSTQCQAWRGQYEIDKLLEAGYIIIDVQRFV